LKVSQVFVELSKQTNLFMKIFDNIRVPSHFSIIIKTLEERIVN